MVYKDILWAWSHLLPKSTPWGRQERCYEPHFSDEETEAQKGHQQPRMWVSWALHPCLLSLLLHRAVSERMLFLNHLEHPQPKSLTLYLNSAANCKMVHFALMMWENKHSRQRPQTVSNDLRPKPHHFPTSAKPSPSINESTFVFLDLCPTETTYTPKPEPMW